MHHHYNPSLLLSLLFGFSGSRYWEWVDAFGSAAAVLDAPAGELKQLTPQVRQQLQCYQAQGENSPLAKQAKRVTNKVDAQSAAIIDHNNDTYPLLLKHIHRPPPLLFIKGNTDILSMPQIAIVGSRHATKTGLQNSYDFSALLANHGFAVTSGLAIGIDGAAHRGALSVAGKSIGVMATGIDSIYPRQHRSLADDIVAKGGVLVTEFFPGTAVKPKHFPQRNRIISGLCAGVLVVEAAVKSGSLITARYALEQDREIFAMPGSIHNPQSKGPHLLIKEGAHLVESASDIVEQLHSFLYSDTQQNDSHLPLVSPPSEDKRESCSEPEQRLLDHMDFEPANIDQLSARSGLPAAELSALLISLELKQYICASEWGYEKVGS